MSFREITSCLVRYNDVRYENVVRISEEKTALPSLPMPDAKIQSEWRIVDLGMYQLHCLKVDKHYEEKDIPRIDVMFGDLEDDA